MRSPIRGVRPDQVLDLTEYRDVLHPAPFVAGAPKHRFDGASKIGMAVSCGGLAVERKEASLSPSRKHEWRGYTDLLEYDDLSWAQPRSTWRRRPKNGFRPDQAPTIVQVRKVNPSSALIEDCELDLNEYDRRAKHARDASSGLYHKMESSYQAMTAEMRATAGASQGPVLGSHIIIRRGSPPKYGRRSVSPANFTM